MPNNYVCAISGKPINKNHESYRGRMTLAMVAAIRKDHPKFHPKDDILKEVGEKYWAQVESKGQPAWMDSPLG